jgi:hypothetical protein
MHTLFRRERSSTGSNDYFVVLVFLFFSIYLLSLYRRGNLLQDENLCACLQYFCQLHHHILTFFN